MITKKQIETVLKTIPDPEIGVSLWDLGLIYNIEIVDNSIEILMTLTTIGCPLFEHIEGPMREELGKLKGMKKLTILLTFEPAWSPDKMSEEAKAQLGF